MSRPAIIGLTGYAGVGKDTVRAMLEERGFNGMAFADPIRDMIRTLLTGAGLDQAYMDERALKETIIPELGVSYRHMAQTLGTEWGRSLGADFWLRLAGAYMADCENAEAWPQQFVISDVRFANEAQWLRDKGGVIWRIERPGTAPVRAHVSESEVYHIVPDAVIPNTGTVDQLYLAVESTLESFR